MNIIYSICILHPFLSFIYIHIHKRTHTHSRARAHTHIHCASINVALKQNVFACLVLVSDFLASGFSLRFSVCTYINLARKQNVFTCLGHGPVGRRHDQNSSLHLRRA